MQFNTYTELVEQELGQLNLPNDPPGLYEPLRYFLQIGGKRIRPVLTLMAAQLYGDPKNALSQALAIELFHNFTLIHDDIMDNAPLRRGVKTVHEKWDNNTAILSGDVLMIAAYRKLIQGAGDKLSPILELFNQTAVEVCEGQQRDMDFEQRIDVSAAEYIEMIRLKTSVLLGTALKLGAMINNAPASDAENLYEFGVHVGIAFQIQDDILDLYADPEKFGKQVGGDIIANKKTILYLTAIGNASKDQLQVLKNIHADANPKQKVEKAKQLFDHLKVREQCEDLLHEHLGKAMFHLEEVAIDDADKQMLRELAIYLVNREN